MDAMAAIGLALQGLPQLTALASLSDVPATAAAARKLEESRIQVKKGLRKEGRLLDRSVFGDFRDIVEAARKADDNTTLLVYGPRGVGKTSLVAAALQDAPGVVCASYHGNDSGNPLDWLERVTVDVTVTFLEPQAPRAVLGDRLRAILDKYEEQYKRRAIIVIDINSEVSPDALKVLLLHVKELGYEEMRATFIVVVSASRSALGLTIGMSELRVRGYAAPDFTLDEAQRYIRQHLPAFPGIASSITDAIGTRAIHLAEVRERCSGAQTEQECMQRVVAYREARLDDAERALSGFMAIAEDNTASSEDKRRAFLSQLLEGTDVLKERAARDAFGFRQHNLLLRALAEYHAFAVDPFDSKVSMQSHFMRIAIEQYLGV